MRQLVVAVDPGGRDTGIVVRAGDSLHHNSLVTRTKTDDFDWYIHMVVDEIIRARDYARNLALQSSNSANPFTGGTLLAVEDLNDPTPQMGQMAVRGLIDTAQVIGAISGQQWVITRIPPAGHGTKPLYAYPTALVGANEKRGGGKRRHLRAAWDIAGHATLLHRTEAAS